MSLAESFVFKLGSCGLPCCLLFPVKLKLTGNDRKSPSAQLLSNKILIIFYSNERGRAPRAGQVLMWIPGREKLFKYGSAGVSHTSIGSFGGKAKQRCFQNRGVP